MLILGLTTDCQLKYPKIWSYTDMNRYFYIVKVAPADTLYGGGSVTRNIRPKRIYLDKSVFQVEGVDSMPVKSIKWPADPHMSSIPDVKTNQYCYIRVNCYGGATVMIWDGYMTITYPAAQGLIVQYVLDIKPTKVAQSRAPGYGSGDGGSTPLFNVYIR